MSGVSFRTLSFSALRADGFSSCTKLLVMVPCLALACNQVTVFPLPSEDDGAGGSGGAGGADNAENAVERPFEPGENQGFISSIDSTNFGSGQDFGQDAFPENIYGPPLGGGATSQSLDVVSLGDGGSVTFRFDRPVVDEEGADFVIFENPFTFGSQDEIFFELAQVFVSEDGENFLPFPCDVETTEGCAGVTPVLLNGSLGGQGELNAVETGGDAFDLKDLELSEIQAVRIVDIADDEQVFDLDAALALHLKKRDASQ